MVKLTILYRTPVSAADFETRYNQNLAFMEKMPGIKRRQACVVWGNPAGNSPFARILELYFDSRDDLDKALLSPEGRQAGGDLMQFARDSELLFSDVYED